ncbi:MAG: ATP-binding protein, partial [Gaiellaceae bacterium]
LIEIETVPPPEVIEESTKPMIEAVEDEEPSFIATVGDKFVCKGYLAMDTSPNDPYYTSDSRGTADTIIVVVNRRHPQWSQLGDSESVLTYLRHCVYDAIAEWQCRRITGMVQPHTIKALKDNLLRLPARIEEAAAAAPLAS